MATQKSIEAGKGHVSLGTDDSALKKGLDAAAARFQAWGQQIGAMANIFNAIGKQITDPFLKGLGVFADWGEAVRRGAQIAGVRVEAFQEIAGATRQSAEELSVSMRHMSQFMFHAASGTEQTRDALAALGLTFADLASLSPDQQILRLADGFRNLNNESARTGVAMEIFGRQGVGIMNQLRLGTEALRVRMQETRENGGVLSEADVALATVYNRSLSLLNTAIRGTWASLGAAAAPAMIEFYNAVRRIILVVKEFVDSNREMLGIVFRVFDAMVTAAIPIGLLAGAFQAAGLALRFVMPMLTAFSAGALALGNAIYFAATGFGTFGLVSQAVMGAYAISVSVVTALTTGWGVALGAVASAGFAVGIALAGVIAVGAGLAGIAFAVQSIGFQFANLHASLQPIDDAIQAIVDAARHVWDWIIDTPVAALVSTLGSLWDTISGVFSGFKGFLDQIGVTAFLGDLLNVVLGIAGVATAIVGLAGYGAYLAYEWGVTGGGLVRLWEQIKQGWQSVLAIFSGGDGGFMRGLAAAWQIYVGVLMTSIGLIRSAVQTIYAPFIAIGEGVRSIGDAALTAASTIWGSFTDAASRIGTAFSTAISRTWTGFVNMFGAIFEAGRQAFQGLYDAFSAGNWELMWSIAKTAAELAWVEISAFAVDAFNAWSDALEDAFNTLWNALRDMFTTGWAFLKEGWHTLAASIITAMIPIQTALTTLLTAAVALPGEAGEAASRALQRLAGINLQARANDQTRAARDAREGAAEEILINWHEANRQEQELADTRGARDTAAAEGRGDEAARLQTELDARTLEADFNRKFAEATQTVVAPESPNGEFNRAKGEVLGGFSAAALTGIKGSVGESIGERTERLNREDRQERARQAAEQLRVLNLILGRVGAQFG